MQLSNIQQELDKNESKNGQSIHSKHVQLAQTNFDNVVNVNNDDQDDKSDDDNDNHNHSNNVDIDDSINVDDNEYVDNRVNAEVGISNAMQNRTNRSNSTSPTKQTQTERQRAKREEREIEREREKEKEKENEEKTTMYKGYRVGNRDFASTLNDIDENNREIAKNRNEIDNIIYPKWWPNDKEFNMFQDKNNVNITNQALNANGKGNVSRNVPTIYNEPIAFDVPREHFKQNNNGKKNDNKNKTNVNDYRKAKQQENKKDKNLLKTVKKDGNVIQVHVNLYPEYLKESINLNQHLNTISNTNKSNKSTKSSSKPKVQAKSKSKSKSKFPFRKSMNENNNDNNNNNNNRNMKNKNRNISNNGKNNRNRSRNKNNGKMQRRLENNGMQQEQICSRGYQASTISSMSRDADKQKVDPNTILRRSQNDLQPCQKHNDININRNISNRNRNKYRSRSAHATSRQQGIRHVASKKQRFGNNGNNGNNNNSGNNRNIGNRSLNKCKMSKNKMEKNVTNSNLNNNNNNKSSYRNVESRIKQEILKDKQRYESMKNRNKDILVNIAKYGLDDDEEYSQYYSDLYKAPQQQQQQGANTGLNRNRYDFKVSNTIGATNAAIMANELLQSGSVLNALNPQINNDRKMSKNSVGLDSLSQRFSDSLGFTNDENIDNIGVDKNKIKENNFLSVDTNVANNLMQGGLRPSGLDTMDVAITHLREWVQGLFVCCICTASFIMVC